jgi:hypothetical protein
MTHYRRPCIYGFTRPAREAGHTGSFVGWSTLGSRVAGLTSPIGLVRMAGGEARLTNVADLQALPKIEELYEYARLRGFFHPELERYYWTRFPFIAERLPALLRAAAQSR